MPPSMSWLFFAALQPFFHGAANIIDQFLANRHMPEPWTLIFYTSFFNLLFLPVIILIDAPSWPTASQWPVLILLGLTGFAYLFPYYRSLQTADTSVVASLFSLGRIFVPLLAFLFVGESLTNAQYVGFVCIVIASALITFHPSRFRFNVALGYMTLASIIIALEAVAVKYLFNTSMSWGTLAAFASVFTFLAAMPLLLVPRIRKSIRSSRRGFLSALPLFALEETFTFAGPASAIYAISLAPVTYIITVESFQPVVVLLYALFFKRFLPRSFKEELNARALLVKIPLFAVMILGIWIMSR